MTQNHYRILLANKHECLITTRYCAPEFQSQIWWTSQFLGPSFEDEVTKWLQTPLGLVVSGLRANRISRHLPKTKWVPEACLSDTTLCGPSCLSSSILKEFSSDEKWIIMGDRLAPMSSMIGLVGINPGSPSKTTMFHRNFPNNELLIGLEKGMKDYKIQKLRVRGSINKKAAIIWNKFISVALSSRLATKTWFVHEFTQKIWVKQPWSRTSWQKRKA